MALLFHGTAHRFAGFDEAFIGRGADENSALGIHTSEWPLQAAEYAESSVLRDKSAGEPLVLAIEAPLEKTCRDLDYYAFFGYDEAGEQIVHRAEFAALRRKLIAGGCQAIEYEDGEQQIVVLLNPANARIVASLSLADAEALEDRIAKLADPYCAEARFRLLMDLLEA